MAASRLVQQTCTAQPHLLLSRGRFGRQGHSEISQRSGESQGERSTSHHPLAPLGGRSVSSWKPAKRSCSQRWHKFEKQPSTPPILTAKKFRTRKRGWVVAKSASSSDDESKPAAQPRGWWNPLGLFQGNGAQEDVDKDRVDLDGEGPAGTTERPGYQPLETRNQPPTQKDPKGPPIPQKRIRDMKVIERDGRKIVTIGNVGSSASSLKASEPQEKGDSEEQDAEQGAGRSQQEERTEKEARPTTSAQTTARPQYGDGDLSEAEGLFARLRASPQDLAAAQAKYDQLLQDPLVGLELIRSARRYLFSLKRRSRPFGWLHAPLAIAPLGALYPLAVTLAFQAMATNFSVGIAALLAIDTGVVVLLDVFVSLMGNGAPHLWLPGGDSPWTKPWLSDGHPAGFRVWVRATLLLGFVLPSLALGASYLVGAQRWGLAMLLPYLSVFAVQTVFEQSLLARKSALWPVVVLLFTVYRLVQIDRARVIATDVAPFLEAQVPVWLRGLVEVLSVLWTFNTAVVIAQLPWYYLRWGQQQAEQGAET